MDGLTVLVVFDTTEKHKTEISVFNLAVRISNIY